MNGQKEKQTVLRGKLHERMKRPRSKPKRAPSRMEVTSRSKWPRMPWTFEKVKNSNEVFCHDQVGDWVGAEEIGHET